MEKEYFTWEEFDYVDEGCYNFMKCTVIKPFGPYKVGDKVDCLTVDFQNGKIEEWVEEEVKVSLSMHLVIE